MQKAKRFILSNSFYYNLKKKISSVEAKARYKRTKGTTSFMSSSNTATPMLFRDKFTSRKNYF